MGNPFYVQPANIDAGPVLRGLGEVATKTREKREQQNSLKKRQSEMMDAYKSGDPDKVAEMTFKYPELTGAMNDVLGDRTEQEELARGSQLVQELSDPEGIPDRMQQQIQSLQAQGQDTSQLESAFQQYTDNPEGFLKGAEMEFARVSTPQQWKAYQQQKKGDQGGSDLKVGAQEILEDGTIIQSTNKGPVVYDSLGNKVKGKEAASAVKQARAAKVSNARKSAGGRRRAALEAEEDLKGRIEAGIVSQKGAADISVKAFDKLEKINLNISNMDEAIKAIDQGASTGFVMSKIPSIRTASLKLDNLQKRLGLDVVSGTTFGALSKGELDLALSAAMPTNMQQEELKKWLVDKKNAMEKMSDYVEASAIYLGTPGNTVKGYIEYQRGKQADKKAEQEQPQPPQQDASTQAMEWAKANPNDPRAAQIMQKLGGQ